MSDAINRLHSFLKELRRRNVYRVAITYVVVAFVGLEAVDLLIPATTLPAWSDEFLLAIAIMGFPLAVVVAWAFELTPEGLRRTPSAEADVGPGEPPISGKRLFPAVLVGLSVVAVLVLGGWYLLSGGAGESEITDRSIAVLPFETLGEERATSFTDGIHGDLLTRLSHVSDLSVISRTSVMRYRTSEEPLPAIAAELGVAWILRGEVQETADQVQVNARLVDARTDHQVWADSYQRKLTAENLFDIQAEITREIALALESHLTPQEEEQVERAPTESVDAYRLYTQARRQLDQRTEPGMRRALDGFQRAIATDPTYVIAWVGLADALALLHDYGYVATDSALPHAEGAVRRALELNPKSAEAHASLGLLRSEHHEGPAAVRELERAVELRPGYAEAYNWLSWVHLLLGDEAKALANALRAVELNPLSPEAVSNLSMSYLANGEYDSALVEARRVGEVQAAFSTGQFYEGLALYQLGRYMEAATVLEDLAVPWAGSGPLATLALARVASGDSAAARQLLARIDGTAEPFAAGLIHAALGERDLAFDAFQRLDRWGDWPTLSIRHFYNDVWSALRDDPRYDELARQVDRDWGLVPDQRG